MRKAYRKHVVRGKTPAEWAVVLGVSREAIYKWIYAGELESHIDGKKAGRRPKTHFGLTRQQLAERFGVSSWTIRLWAENGTLERRLNGETVPRKKRPPTGLPIYGGMTCRELSERLGGISRQRVHQLIQQGKIRERLDGTNFREVERKRNLEFARQETIETVRAAMAERKPGESIPQLAARTGIARYRLRRYGGKRPNFAAERRKIREAAKAKGTPP